MSFRPATKKHFFSLASKVSFELPTDWSRTEEGEREVTYTGPAAGDARLDPIIVVRVLPGAGTDGAAEELARQFVAQAPAGAVAHIAQDVEIAGFIGRLVGVTFPNEDLGGSVMTLQAWVRVERIVFGFTGIADEAGGAAFAPLFRAALQSVRFIPL